MPNRILKETICTSDNLDKLSAFHETVFYRMIVNCDDFGRMDARPRILASRLFPLKDIRASQMEDALRALTSAELVTLYEVDGKPFLQMKTWDRHQQIRAKKSKYPGPEDGVMASDINCNQMISSASKCPRNPIQSESESESESESKHDAHDADEAFDAFWAVYPRKVGKGAARKSFDKLPRDVWPKLVPAVEAQKQSRQWQRDGGQFVPHPATWLNQGRWDDEPESATQGLKPNEIRASNAPVAPDKINAALAALEKI